MGGGTTVQAPQPSAEERALQAEQLSLLREQRATTQEMLRQQGLLSPILYEQMGVIPQVDSSGKIVSFSKAPVDPAEAAFRELQTKSMQASLDALNDPKRKEIDQLLQGRTLAALKGELPVDPGLERQLKEGRSTLEETLLKQIGPGYATSTPGIEALANFDKRATELRTAAQTGQLTLAEQLSNARAASSQQQTMSAFPGYELADKLRTNSLGSIMGIGNNGWNGVGAFGQTAGGYNSSLNWYAQQRQAQLQAQMANAQSDNSFMGTLGSLFGTGMMAYAAYASDRRLKSGIKLLGRLRSGLKVYSYRIFGVRDIGVMADEARKLFPDAVRRLAAGFDVVDYSKIG